MQSFNRICHLEVESLPARSRITIKERASNEFVREFEARNRILQSRRNQAGAFGFVHRVQQSIGIYSRRGLQDLEGERSFNYRGGAQRVSGTYAQPGQPTIDHEANASGNVQVSKVEGFTKIAIRREKLPALYKVFKELLNEERVTLGIGVE
jgi:hypothetical protein